VISIPRSGICAVYAVSDTSTTGSTAGNYHIVKVLRCGQHETGLSYDTRNTEIQAFTPFYLGTLSVGVGDVLTVSVSVSGTNSVTLYPDNFSLRCELTPRT